MCVHEQNITVVLNSKKRAFTPVNSYDGFSYSLDADTGNVLADPVAFGATTYHQAIAVFASYQVFLFPVINREQ